MSQEIYLHVYSHFSGSVFYYYLYYVLLSLTTAKFIIMLYLIHSEIPEFYFDNIKTFFII